MVDVTVTITDLTINTRSADLVGSGSAVTTGQTVSFPAGNKTNDLLLVLEETGSSTASIVFDAGDNPPSMGSDLGSLTISMAANDLRIIMLEGGRFIQADSTTANRGKITATVTGTMKVYAYRLPKKG